MKPVIRAPANSTSSAGFQPPSDQGVAKKVQGITKNYFKNVLVRALQGAAMGGLAGCVVGGPVGTLTGALGGAVLGALYGALEVLTRPMLKAIDQGIRSAVNTMMGIQASKTHRVFKQFLANIIVRAMEGSLAGCMTGALFGGLPGAITGALGGAVIGSIYGGFEKLAKPIASRLAHT